MSSLKHKILKCKRLIRSLGYKIIYDDLVKRWGEYEEFTSGGVRYRDKKVFINTRRKEIKDPKFLLLLLSHEIGHILATNRGYKITHEDNDEIKAYLFGWLVIKKLKLKISKKDWRKFNYIN